MRSGQIAVFHVSALENQPHKFISICFYGGRSIAPVGFVLKSVWGLVSLIDVKGDHASPRMTGKIIGRLRMNAVLDLFFDFQNSLIRICGSCRGAVICQVKLDDPIMGIGKSAHCLQVDIGLSCVVIFPLGGFLSENGVGWIDCHGKSIAF